MPRFIFGFDASIPEPLYKPERGRELLREAGFARGFSVVLHARRIFSEGAFLVKQQLEEIGVRVEVRVLSDPEFFEAQDRKELSFWLTRFGCVTGEASNILENVIHSPDAARRLGQMNWGGYADPALDRAIDASGEIEKTEDRRKAVQRIMNGLMKDLPIIPLYVDEDLYALDRSLAWRPRDDGYVRAADVRIRR